MMAHRFITCCLLFAIGINSNVFGQAQPTHVVDCSTLEGKVMCGYQGWFNCDGDRMDAGWKHWAIDPRKPFAPGNVHVDLWPDVSELGDDERFATGFRHADGSPAEVFSSAKRKTVIRHFRWMQEYGIDGAFVQRFTKGIGNRPMMRHKNAVLSHARAGAEQHARAFAVMYDLSGMETGTLKRVRDDWLNLKKNLGISQSEAYLHHMGKPLVALWGVGFRDRHESGKYTLNDCRKLITALRSAGCSIMLGVPNGWRELKGDSVAHKQLHEIIKLADVISPWTVGRYRDPSGVARHADKHWMPDIQWCDKEHCDYLPVVFPGFSWHNMKQGAKPLGSIPRLKGEFLWSQIVSAKRSGARMIYVAMFDEVDEGTAIFKCTNDPPVGGGVRFLTYEGLPSDYYLEIVGHAGKLLSGEVPMTDTLPKLAPRTADKN